MSIFISTIYIYISQPAIGVPPFMETHISWFYMKPYIFPIEHGHFPSNQSLHLWKPTYMLHMIRYHIMNRQPYDIINTNPNPLKFTIFHGDIPGFTAPRPLSLAERRLARLAKQVRRPGQGWKVTWVIGLPLVMAIFIGKHRENSWFTIHHWI